MNDLDVWSYRIPTGLFIKIFGIPFFAAGFFILQEGLLINEDANALPSVVIKLGIYGFSSVFMLVGVILIGGVKKLAINKRENKLITSWGLLVPFYKSSEVLEEFNKIELTKEIRVTKDSKGKTSKRIYYPVSLRKNSKNKQHVFECSSLLKSRQISEELARFFICPIRDTSTGKTLIRNPDELDFNLGQMMQKNDETVDKPNTPESLTNSIVEDYDHNGEKRTTVTLPRHCLTMKSIFVGVTISTFVCASFLAFHIMTHDPQRGGSYFNLIFKFTFMIPGVGFLILFPKFLLGLAQESIGVSKSTLKYTLKLIIPFTKTVDLNKLEYLLIQDCPLKEGTGEIDLISDNLFLKVVKHHKLEALRFIEQLVKYKVQNK